MLNFTNQATQFDKSGYSDRPTVTSGYGQSENKQALTPSRTVNISRPQMDMSHMVSVMGGFTQQKPGGFPDRSMVFMDRPSAGKPGRGDSNGPSSGEIRAFFGGHQAPMMDEESTSNYYSSCAPQYEAPAEDTVYEEMPAENCESEPEPPAYPQQPSYPVSHDRRPTIINNYYQQNNYYCEPAPTPAADQTYQPPKEMPCPSPKAEYPPPAADKGYYQDCPMEDSAPPKYCPPTAPKPPKHPPAPPANDYSYEDCPMPAPKPPKHQPANDYSYENCPEPAPKPMPKPPKQPPANDYSYADCPPPAVKPPKQPPAKDKMEDCPPPPPPKEDCPPPPAYDGGDQGGYWGDPHLEGFDGEKYDVMGKAGNTYNMISDKGFQYNTKFIPLGEEGNTAIGEAGFQVGDEQVKFDAKTKTAWLNDKELEKNKEVALKAGGTILWSGDELKVNSKEYNVDLKVQNEWNTNYLNSDVKLNGSPFADNVKPHGLLGQTADGVKGLKNNGKDLGKQGGTVIDGTVEDYEVGGLFDTQFKNNNRFKAS